MNTPRKMIVTLLAALTLGAGPALAYKGDCGPMGYGMYGQGSGSKAERMQERYQARHEQLHKELKLTEAQEPAWKAFSEKSGPRAAGWQGPDREAMSKLTAPERMEKMLEMSKQHQAFMSERLEALKAFYAVLTPEQQKIFDEFQRGPQRNKGKR